MRDAFCFASFSERSSFLEDFTEGYSKSCGPHGDYKTFLIWLSSYVTSFLGLLEGVTVMISGDNPDSGGSFSWDNC